MNYVKDISAGKNVPEEINVVVEIPLGSNNKYEYDAEGGYFSLDRTSYSPFYRIDEYGFIPQTAGGDGDPLDVCLLATRPTFTGCVVKARPIGVLVMRDEEGIDNKIIAVPISKVEPRFKHINIIDDVPEHFKQEMLHYWSDYKKLEKEKYEHVKVEGFESLEKAKELIKEAVEKYKNQ